MKENGLADARKIPDVAMDYIRRIAVHAVIDGHFKPTLVAEVLNISRSSIYEWLSWYRDAGDEGLDTHKAPGATLKITPKIELWLKHTILHSTPSDYGYDTELWTLEILADLLKTVWDIDVYPSTVANHLHRLNLSCQVPQYRAHECDTAEVDRFISEKWPKIQKVADKLGADIAFEDEAGIGIRTRSGRTWGEVNSPPTVRTSDERGGCNVFSAITREGDLYYRIEDKSIGSEEYISFLEQILNEHPRPIVLVVDHASFHPTKKVRDFVRAHRDRIRVFFFPKHAPHVNPAEQVWNEIKHRRLGRKSIFSKEHLKMRILSEFIRLRDNVDTILSFFHLKDTSYTLNPQVS